jgi:hypothetical protein
MLGACTVLATYEVDDTAKISFTNGESWLEDHGVVIYTKDTAEGRKYLVEFTQEPAEEKSRQERPVPPINPIYNTQKNGPVASSEAGPPPTCPARLVSDSSDAFEEPELPKCQDAVPMTPDQQKNANEELKTKIQGENFIVEDCNLILRFDDPAAWPDRNSETYIKVKSIEERMSGRGWFYMIGGIPEGFADNVSLETWQKHWSAGTPCFQKALKGDLTEHALISWWQEENCWIVEYWFLQHNQWSTRILYQFGKGNILVDAKWKDGKFLGAKQQEKCLASPFTGSTNRAGAKLLLPTFPPTIPCERCSGQEQGCRRAGCGLTDLYGRQRNNWERTWQHRQTFCRGWRILQGNHIRAYVESY